MQPLIILSFYRVSMIPFTLRAKYNKKIFTRKDFMQYRVNFSLINFKQTLITCHSILVIILHMINIFLN